MTPSERDRLRPLNVDSSRRTGHFGLMQLSRGERPGLGRLVFDAASCVFRLLRGGGIRRTLRRTRISGQRFPSAAAIGFRYCWGTVKIVLPAVSWR